MSKLHVSLISHTYLEARYRGKLSHLAQHVDLTLISPKQIFSPYGMYQADFSEARNYHVRVYPCLFPTSVHTSTRWALASRNLGFSEAQPDIIHIENEAHSFSLIQAMLYRKLYTPRAKLVVFSWANQHLRGAKGLVMNTLARFLRPGIDFYITGNSAGRELLLESGVSSEKIAVFPQSGVSLSPERIKAPEVQARVRADLNIGMDEFVIGFVGRIVTEKGIHDLLQSFQQLQSQQYRVRLLCVGSGDLKDDLLDLQPEVIVVSPGMSSQVTSYYQAMDVLVLPSRTEKTWSEQFGRVLIEAMSAGVPVIGSDSGAIPEVIADAGLTFPEKDVARLTHLLRQVYTDPNLRANLVQRGIERVSSCYTDESIALQTLRVYEQLGKNRAYRN